MKIENQAMMFALLCKYTVLAKGEEGREIIQKGMKRYGRERGARMAARAGNNGDPVCLWTNQAYGEWKPGAWCEAWKKYDILEYGREYCVNVDAAVYEGFGGGFGCDAVCTPVSKAMSWGGEICRFDWGLPLSSDDQARIAEKKAELGTDAMKDFAYHTAHIFCAVTDEICKAFPDESKQIIDKAVGDYIEIFGQEDYDAMLEYSPADFQSV